MLEFSGIWSAYLEPSLLHITVFQSFSLKWKLNQTPNQMQWVGSCTVLVAIASCYFWVALKEEDRDAGAAVV